MPLINIILNMWETIFLTAGFGTKDATQFSHMWIGGLYYVYSWRWVKTGVSIGCDRNQWGYR